MSPQDWSYDCIKHSHKKLQGLDSMFSYIGHAHHVINLITMIYHKTASHEKYQLLWLLKFWSLAWDIIVSDAESHHSATRMTQTLQFHNAKWFSNISRYEKNLFRHVETGASKHGNAYFWGLIYWLSWIELSYISCS
jgi:hypothetical protein